MLSQGEREEFESLLQGVDADFKTASADASASSSESDALLKALAKMSASTYQQTALSRPDKPLGPLKEESAIPIQADNTYPHVGLDSVRDIEVRNGLPQRWIVDARVITLGDGKTLVVVISGFISKEEFAATDVRVRLLHLVCDEISNSQRM